MQIITSPAGFYQRLWTAPLALWYLIWQCLHSRTLEAVVSDARRGGADRLCHKGKRLSRDLRSTATTSFSNARQRLPLAWVRQCFSQIAAYLISLYHQSTGTVSDLPVRLLDGSTKRLRPYGDVPEHHPPHRTRRKESYWCVARILVSFCATTGIATGALIGSIHLSEQALAVQLLLQAPQGVLYVGDRNFGIWRVARAAVQSRANVLLRLTRARTRRLYGKKRLPLFLDQALCWKPTRRDQVDPGLIKEDVIGRLVIIHAHRPGYRPQRLYFFTTLIDAELYPPERLLEIYGWRWQVELNYRTLKDTMGMAQSETKSADMVAKEFYAGLIAYNLVRGLMAGAAAQAGCKPAQLSFSKVHGLLASILTELFLHSMCAAHQQQRLFWLLTEAAAARLPRRRKQRLNEPRRQYYPPQAFPRMTTTRAKARRVLKNSIPKC